MAGKVNAGNGSSAENDSLAVTRSTLPVVGAGGVSLACDGRGGGRGGAGGLGGLRGGGGGGGGGAGGLPSATWRASREAMI
jgi:hypothetical protein